MRLALAAAATLVLGACAPAAPASPQVVPTAAPRPVRPPPVGHILLLVMENRDYQDIIGSPDAPYLNALAGQYALADNYGLRHPSLPNYLALLGGDTFGIDSNCTRCIIDAPNLVDALEAAGKTWKSYQEDLPVPCFLGSAAGGYAAKHDPFVYFRDIRDNPSRCQQVVPLAQLADDLQAARLPDLAFVTPNLRHDMHDGSVAQGDGWLAGFLPAILASDAWRPDGLVLITWDEGRDNADCCGGATGGHTPLVAISPRGKPGYHTPHPVTPYGVLRTIEEVWGLGYLGHTGDPGVASLLDIFAD